MTTAPIAKLYATNLIAFLYIGYGLALPALGVGYIALMLSTYGRLRPTDALVLWVFVSGIRQFLYGARLLLRRKCLADVSAEGINGIPWQDIRYLDATEIDGTMRKRAFVSLHDRRQRDVGIRISTADTNNARAFQQVLDHYWPDWRQPWKQQLASRAN